MSESTDSSGEQARLPRERIDAYVDPLRHFLHIESASGVVLLAAAAAALVLANSPLADRFLAIWKAPLGFTIGSFSVIHSVKHWINDGLMAVFFFVVGLEVKREFVMGELRDMRQAALPIAAALGGMIVPAGVYLALQYGAPGMRGWGIPMATDIAFVVGCMAVLGRRIPPSLRVLMLSLAIADDIGAILVIAIGYTESLNLTSLALAAAGIGVIVFLMHLGLRNFGVYLLMMVLVWFGVHESGVHATLAGVVFGLMTPARAWISEGRLGRMVEKTSGFLGGESWESPEHRYSVLSQLSEAARKSISPLQRFETGLHPWVGFLIMPVFALANAGVTVETSYFTSPVAVAVMLGLLVGKPLGIVGVSWLAVRLGLARLPEGVGWGAVLGGGFLAGIGFTMAMFIASLALAGDLLDAAKVGILVGSLLSAIAGVVLLILFLPKPAGEADTAGETVKH
jgi:NhaA family Na+:H+ antiporter